MFHKLVSEILILSKKEFKYAVGEVRNFIDKMDLKEFKDIVK